MNKTIRTPYLAFKKHAIRHIFVSPLGQDNRLAHAVGQPLFDAGIDQAAISERMDYRADTPQKYDWHEVSLVLQGEMHMVMNGRKYNLKAGDLTVCPIGTVITRHSGKSGVWWMYFTMPDHPAWEPLKKQPASVRPYESAALMFLLLRDTLDVLKNQEPVSVARAQDNCRALVNLLRHEMIRPGMAHSQKSIALQRLSEAIRSAPAKRWSRRAIANTLHLSVSQTSRLFREHFGFAPKELVIRQRMMKANQMLVNTDLKIETIAEELGYTSLHSFTHVFTRKVGMPPSQYRTRFAPSARHSS